jgi:hypothetical protein
MDLEERLANIAHREIAPEVIRSIEKADEHYATHRGLNEEIRTELASVRARVESLNLGIDDKETLIAGIDRHLEDWQT